MAGDEQAADPKRLAVRNITAATVGNALEFSDFITYAFFAIQIGRCFFPNTNAYANLMLSLATFGAGFITRPIGGIIIGSYADRVGRRPAMILSFTLMGVAIIAMALIPSYARIGIAAPILAVLARMVQGFSLGGEVGPTTAYLLESAPLHRRGFVVAWQAASQAIAATLAGLVGLILASTLSASALTDYGWRIAFLLGAVTLPVGLWMRRGLPETLHEPEHHTVAPATKTASVYATFRQNARVIVLGLIVLASGTIGTYLFNYLTTFAQSTLKMTPTVAFAGTFAQNVISLFAVLFGGWLSDRIGRRPVMIYPRFLFLILLLPAFYWIVEARSATALIVGSAILSLLSSVGGGAFYAALTESLPKRIRGGAFATIYAFSIALFGGTTQLVVTWLIHVTGNPMAPAYYWLIAATIGTAAAMAIIESAPVRAISRPVLAE